MAVAVFDDDKWQRAEVIFVSGSDAFIHFIDAGYRKYVKANKLRYLEKMIAAQARLCYKGSLFGVKPSNGESLWSVDAMKFILKAKEKKMFATVKEQKDGIYQLSLIDDKKSRVSDLMVKKGLAEALKNLDFFKNAILVSNQTKLNLNDQ